MDLDAVWGAIGSVEEGWYRRGGDHRREGAVFCGGDVGHPIVTNEDFVAQLIVILCCEGGDDEALPNSLIGFLVG